ncbi:hypothetical protein QTG56_23160 (plasmid) [Rossellomorea sp. AcN35-11]|nr:hypothetical protein [Rossellomorea aquimaris]WJV32266.1 hypothetical protein QTG56_23160 [Rossellomorea sp. AcN35-11]
MKNQQTALIEFTDATGVTIPVIDNDGVNITVEQVNRWAQISADRLLGAIIINDFSDKDNKNLFTVWIDDERKCSFSEVDIAEEVAERINVQAMKLIKTRVPKSPNLKCPECGKEFYKSLNVYEEYFIKCPNRYCNGVEGGINTNLQFFIPINQTESIRYGVSFSK